MDWTLRTEFEQSFDILIIGDSVFQEKIERLCSEGVYHFVFAQTTSEALDAITRQCPALAILRFDAPEVAPFQIVERLTAQNANFPIVMLASAPSTDVIVKSMQRGVQDFLKFPDDLYKLPELTQRFRARSVSVRDALPDETNEPRFETIIGNCPAILQVKRTVARLSKLKRVTVLILGETGSGKEVIARAIHEASTNCSHEGDLVEVNCTAIPENLLEAELFGYERGAFTDAKARKPGLLELAEGGSLFLDEIGDMSLHLQAKLLKAVEEKRFRRLGGTSEININTRIIAGTNADLRRAVAAGRFRQDLYYRLNVMNITLPPLRQRGEDILLLAQYFLRQFSQAYETSITGFDAHAEQMLLHYYWPGNVRELRHVIERAVLMSDGDVIQASDIRSALGNEHNDVARPEAIEAFEEEAQPFPLGRIEIPNEGLSLKNGERRLIEEVLKLTKWNKSRAAEILRISRPRLKRKIEEYHID